jgi:NACalpha-BTF3-like transcription factor
MVLRVFRRAEYPNTGLSRRLRAPKASESGKDVKIDPKDVKLLREQTGCSEEKAVEALKAADGDLINASEWSFWCFLT